LVFIIGALGVSILGMPMGVGAETNAQASRLRERKAAAVEWLLGQMVPNKTVDNPVPWRRNLVISYDIPEEDPAYQYLMGRSYIYDSALAAIAFAMTDRYRAAEDVLLALGRQVQEDGSVWFGVNLHNEWPSEEAHGGATIRSGASAWVGYAATFYLRTRAVDSPDFHTQNRIGKRILFASEKIARHLLNLQISDPDDPRHGLVTGGLGTYDLKAGADEEVISQYTNDTIGWVSAEHNIDVYFLLRDLALLTGGKGYARGAEMILEGLLKMWDDDRRQLIQGIKESGRRDTVLPLDTASWGSILLRQAGELEKADRTLTAGLERFQIGESGLFRPYAEDPLYLDKEVTRAYFSDPDLTWNQLEINWPEGSLGMATALVKAGRTGKARQVIDASSEFAVDAAGGVLRYASLEVPHQFSTYPSVASTAWLVIAVENLLDPQDRSLFWSYE